MLSIGNFSKIANITTKTLRYYDEIGLLKPSHVDSDTGYRFYDVLQLESVLLISRLKDYDFSLEEISQVLNNPKNNAFILSAIIQKKLIIEGIVANYKDVLKKIEDDILNLERGNHFMSYLDYIEVKLMETKPMNILYLREKINIKEYGNYIRKLQERVLVEKLTPTGPPISIFHGEEFNPEHYDVEIGVPVKEVIKGTRDFPSFLCAHAILKGDYSGLTSVYSKIKEWMENEGYIAADAPFEIYVTDPAQTAPEENITEVYFPVKKQS